MLLLPIAWVSLFSAIYAQEVTTSNIADTNVSYRLLNGVKANIEDYPYYAQLWNCGAAIISDKWLVTAAHCVSPKKVRFEVFVGGADSTTRQRYEYDFITLHPDFNTSDILSNNVALFNDIALIRLTQPLKFDKTVKALTLPKHAYEINAVHHFAGREEEGDEEILNSTSSLSAGQHSDQLMKVDYLTMSPDNCLYHLKAPSQYSSPQYKERRIDHLNQLRAVAFCTKQANHWTGLCHGDSGSPLVRNNELVGLASFGARKNCHLCRVGFFTDVFKYVPWIKSFTGIE